MAGGFFRWSLEIRYMSGKGVVAHFTHEMEVVVVVVWISFVRYC